MFAFRRMSPKALIIAAVACLLLQTARENLDYYRDRKMIAKGELIANLDTSVNKLTDLQKEDLGKLSGFKEASTREGKMKKMDKSLGSVRGDYSAFYEYQSERVFHTEVFLLYFAAWDILIFMFLGMAFFKNGILQGTAPAK